MCSYCGCLAITVMEALSREHDQIIEAAGVLRRAADAGDAFGVLSAADALSALLAPHTEGEERGIFRELRAVPEFTTHVDDLCAEHDELDAELAGIMAGDSTLVAAFLRRLRLHIDREEDGLFPAAAIALDGQAWDRIDAVPVGA
jgi:hypothetical protein